MPVSFHHLISSFLTCCSILANAFSYAYPVKGVCASKGSMLLFLHADTSLPLAFDDVIRDNLSMDSTLATAFRFKVRDCDKDDRDIIKSQEDIRSTTKIRIGSGDQKHTTKNSVVGIRWMEWTVNIRSSMYELPFGDQAIAISAQRFKGQSIHSTPGLYDSFRSPCIFAPFWCLISPKLWGDFPTNQSWKILSSFKRFVGPALRLPQEFLAKGTGNRRRGIGSSHWDHTMPSVVRAGGLTWECGVQISLIRCVAYFAFRLEKERERRDVGVG